MSEESPYEAAIKRIGDIRDPLCKFEHGDLEAEVTNNGVVCVHDIDGFCSINPRDFKKLCEWYLDIDIRIKECIHDRHQHLETGGWKNNKDSPYHPNEYRITTCKICEKVVDIEQRACEATISEMDES